MRLLWSSYRCRHDYLHSEERAERKDCLVSDDGDTGVLAPASGDDLMLAVQPEGVLVEGHQSDVEHYVSRLREQAATQGLDPADIRATDVANLGSLAVAAASYAAQSSKFVQLSADSMKALKHGKVIPGDGGFLRMMTRGADGKFLKQLQWKPTSVNPQRLMSVQLIAVQIALRTAIAGIEESLERLDGKVDAVLQLAEADRAGDVLGHHATLTSLVTYLEQNGSLPDALWQSVAGLSPSLNTVLERLRNHVRRVLATLDPTVESVADRSAALRKAITTSKINETFDLLVVAEDSLFRWQRLLIARVRDTDPGHFEGVVDSSRTILAKQLELDGQLYQQSRAVIEKVARRDDLDGFRIWSLPKLTEDRDLMRAALNDFARARRHQAKSWQRLENPGVLDATSAAVDFALESTGRAVSSAGVQLMKFGAYLAEREHDRAPRTQQTRRVAAEGQPHPSSPGPAGGKSDRIGTDPEGTG